jgi:hypothetical protein
MKWIIAIALLALHSHSYADWVVFGGAYKCNARGFAIESTIESSAGNYPASKGFVPIPVGDNKLECNVGGRTVKARILVGSPSTGLDEGAGIVLLASLHINGKLVSEYIEMYARRVFEPHTVKVEVRRQKADITLKICKAEWADDGLVNEKCESQAISR